MENMNHKNTYETKAGGHSGCFFFTIWSRGSISISQIHVRNLLLRSMRNTDVSFDCWCILGTNTYKLLTQKHEMEMRCIIWKDLVQPSRFCFLWRRCVIKMINGLNLPCFVPQAPSTKLCWRLGAGSAPSNPSRGLGWRASWPRPLKQTRACRTRHSTVKPATCASIQRRSSSRWAPNVTGNLSVTLKVKTRCRHYVGGITAKEILFTLQPHLQHLQPTPEMGNPEISKAVCHTHS